MIVPEAFASGANIKCVSKRSRSLSVSTESFCTPAFAPASVFWLAFPHSEFANMKITLSSPLIVSISGNDIVEAKPLVLLSTVKKPELSCPTIDGYIPPVKSLI